MTILMLLVTVIVSVFNLVLLMQGTCAREGVVVEDGMEGAKGVEVIARDDVEELKLHKRS